MKNLSKAVLLLMVCFLLILLLATSGAYFNDSHVLPGNSISTGIWIIPPRVCGCCPCISLLGIWTQVTIQGQGFKPGATVGLVQGDSVIAGSCVKVCSEWTMSASFCLWGVSCGTYDVRVTNPDGGVGILPGGFSIVLSLGGLLSGTVDAVSGTVGAIAGGEASPPVQVEVPETSKSAPVTVAPVKQEQVTPEPVNQPAPQIETQAPAAPVEVVPEPEGEGNSPVLNEPLPSDSAGTAAP